MYALVISQGPDFAEAQHMLWGSAGGRNLQSRLFTSLQASHTNFSYFESSSLFLCFGILHAAAGTPNVPLWVTCDISNPTNLFV